MQYIYSISNGCGSTRMELMLDHDNNKFTLDYRSHWMGSDTIELKFDGNIINKNSNNYFVLEIKSCKNKSDDSEINISGDGNEDYNDACYIDSLNLNFEFVILQKKENFDHDSYIGEFVGMSNGASINRSNFLFDAILYINMDNYGGYTLSNNNLLKEFQDIKVYKFLKLD